jgi:hypothetical protein
VNIGLVMDTSALLAHLRLERVSAGELIGEVNEGGDLVGVPALAMIDVLALLDGDEHARLARMVEWDDNGIVVLPLAGAGPLDVFRIQPRVKGGLGVAHAIVEAGQHGCLLATDSPGDLGSAMSPDDVVVLS